MTWASSDSRCWARRSLDVTRREEQTTSAHLLLPRTLGSLSGQNGHDGPKKGHPILTDEPSVSAGSSSLNSACAWDLAGRPRHPRHLHLHQHPQPRPSPGQPLACREPWLSFPRRKRLYRLRALPRASLGRRPGSGHHLLLHHRPGRAARHLNVDRTTMSPSRGHRGRPCR